MVVGKVVEAGRRLELVEIGAVVGGRLDLRLDADADDGRRNLLDDVGEARHLGAVDAHGFGQHGNGAGGHGAEADRAGDGDRSHRREKARAGLRDRIDGVSHGNILFERDARGSILDEER